MMKSLRMSIRKFRTDDDGVSAVEYAVMLALIFVVAIAGVSAVGAGNNSWWTKNDTAFQSHGI